MRMLFPESAGSLSPAGVADALAWPDGTDPCVRAIMVATADGSARSPKGLSAGISSAADRLVFGTLRGLSDVILAGAETVRSENYGPPKPRPELERRRAEAGQTTVPRVAIVTGSGDLDPTSPLFTQAVEPPLVLAPASLPADHRAALAPVAEIVDCGTDRVEPAAVVAALAERGLRRVALEGGPGLLAQMMAASLVDELCLTVTPLLFGGSDVAHPTPRIMAGSPLPDAPRPMTLAHVIESDGTLFLRYRVGA